MLTYFSILVLLVVLFLGCKSSLFVEASRPLSDGRNHEIQSLRHKRLPLKQHYRALESKSSKRKMARSERCKKRKMQETFKDFFVNQCTSFLLSSPTTDDNIISQVEYADFFSNICITTHNCQEDYTTDYKKLSPILQLEFLWAECDRGDGDCISVFYGDEDEFGFILTNDNRNEIEEKIQALCTTVYPKSVSFHGGTSAPTTSPSIAPGVEPSSLAPTVTPSVEPSSSPIDTKITTTTKEASSTIVRSHAFAMSLNIGIMMLIPSLACLVQMLV